MTEDERILRFRAKRLAQPLAATASADGRQAIVVGISGQAYAFPLADVRRAAVVSALTPVPHAPPIVLGLGICDGDVRAVFDGRVWVGGNPRSARDRMNVLVLGSGASPLCLAVDAFEGSVTLESRELPAAIRTPWSSGVTAQGVLIVNVAALLRDPRFDSSQGSER